MSVAKGFHLWEQNITSRVACRYMKARARTCVSYSKPHSKLLKFGVQEMHV
jgi:hypothetical protein